MKSGKKAIIGIGSNLGYRYNNLHNAINHFRKDMSNNNVNIIKTSKLYETKPMYNTNQSSFINAAIKIETNLMPLDLLKYMQSIENKLGRTTEMRNIYKGPRPIDLDLLIYDNENYIFNDSVLTLPHPGILERPFVLAPLYDVDQELFDRLAIKHPNITNLRLSEDVKTILPLIINNNEEKLVLGEQTHIMGILNCTPDSFSDGSKFSSHEDILLSVTKMIENGASIIDIGGESTRPGAEPVSVEEELERVLPIIKLIREHSNPLVNSIPISIDTYKANVAREAIQYGANIVNDVSGGLFDDNMLSTVAELNVPYILMHLRGNPKTMLDKQYVNYSNIIKEIQIELTDRINEALKNGILAHNIIIDPGLGFAKLASQSFNLLKNIQLLNMNFPLLVGPSRKGFIGKALETCSIKSSSNSTERIWGTAAAVTQCALNGVDIVRVHDVKEMKAVVAVADCIRNSDKFL